MNAALMAYYEVTLGEWKRDAGTEPAGKRQAPGAGARERGRVSLFSEFVSLLCRRRFPVLLVFLRSDFDRKCLILGPNLDLDQFQGW
jgi:hypothetical protein